MVLRAAGFPRPFFVSAAEPARLMTNDSIGRSSPWIRSLRCEWPTPDASWIADFGSARRPNPGGTREDTAEFHSPFSTPAKNGAAADSADMHSGWGTNKKAADHPRPSRLLQLELVRSLTPGPPASSLPHGSRRPASRCLRRRRGGRSRPLRRHRPSGPARRSGWCPARTAGRSGTAR